MKYSYSILIVLLIIVSCKKKEIVKDDFDKNFTKENSKLYIKDSFKIEESFNQIDSTFDKSLDEKLLPIKENFKRINSIENKNWSSITSKFLEGSTEGGEVTYYHLKNNLEKISAKQYGETYQVLTEYYLLKGKLSFVYQRGLQYNRSIWKNVPEESDEEVFDYKKSQIYESRNYFENGILIKQISDEDSTPEYLNERQEEILRNFSKVIKLEKEKN